MAVRNTGAGQEKNGTTSAVKRKMPSPGVIPAGAEKAADVLRFTPMGVQCNCRLGEWEHPAKSIRGRSAKKWGAVIPTRDRSHLICMLRFCKRFAIIMKKFAKHTAVRSRASEEPLRFARTCCARTLTNPEVFFPRRMSSGKKIL